MKKWDGIYKKHEWGKYPPEELIRFVANNYYHMEDRTRIKILEVGCGTGANIWYLCREGFSVWGIDGSKAGIKIAEKYLKAEKLKAVLSVGDFVELPYPKEYFDAVIDVYSIQHNKLIKALKIFSEIYRVLKNNGKFFALIRATGSEGFYKLGDEVEKGTYENVAYGSKNVGLLHFYSDTELKKFLRDFKELKIDYVIRSINNREYKTKHWIVECKKVSLR